LDASLREVWARQADEVVYICREYSAEGDLGKDADKVAWIMSKQGWMGG
jgi:hypothetical protein